MTFMRVKTPFLNFKPHFQISQLILKYDADYLKKKVRPKNDHP